MDAIVPKLGEKRWLSIGGEGKQGRLERNRKGLTCRFVRIRFKQVMAIGNDQVISDRVNSFLREVVETRSLPIELHIRPVLLKENRHE